LRSWTPQIFTWLVKHTSEVEIFANFTLALKETALIGMCTKQFNNKTPIFLPIISPPYAPYYNGGLIFI